MDTPGVRVRFSSERVADGERAAVHSDAAGHGERGGGVGRLMKILAAPPFSSTSLLWQPRPGAWVLTVVCKATFTLLPGECVPAPAPDPLNDTDDHWNDDPRRSLDAASDRVPFKRRADVILVGHAYAPNGQPVSSLIVRLAVAGVNKTIEVHADRAWTQDGQLRDGARFTKMPLRWERAAGGPDTINPVGVRPGARPDMYGQVPIPNLQPPGVYVGWRENVIPSIGFGPVAAWWPTRCTLLHRHAATWDPSRWAQHPLPQDIDAAFFNAAPPDQQVDALHADERITLENLHPEHARLVTRLPGLSPLATVERETMAGALSIRMRCDTLSIDTDRCVCHLVWRGQIVLARPDERGQVTITAEAPGHDESADTLALGLIGPALPFGGSAAPAVARMPATASGPAPTGAAQQDGDLVKTLPPDGGDVGETLFLGPGVVASAALPFQEGRSPWAAIPSVPEQKRTPRSDDDGTGTVFSTLLPSGPTLPFTGGAPAELVPPAAASPVAAMPPVVAPAPGVVTPPPAQSPPAAFSTQTDLPPPLEEPVIKRSPGQPPLRRGPPVIAMPGAFESHSQPFASPAWPISDETRDAPLPNAAQGELAIPSSPAVPAPPPMLGPLAATAPDEAPHAKAAAGGSSMELTPAIQPEPEPEPAHIPIEQAAAISAEIAEGKASRTEVLRAHDVTERAWLASESRWAKAIDDEAAEGSSKLRAAYDRAYVAAVEGFRGPITLPEYARIVVGLERGRATQVLDDLKIQRPALMRVVRLWTKKVATDAKLTEESRGLLIKLRAS